MTDEDLEAIWRAQDAFAEIALELDKGSPDINAVIEKAKKGRWGLEDRFGKC